MMVDPDIGRIAEALTLGGAFMAFTVALFIAARAGIAWTRPRARRESAPTIPPVDESRFTRLEEAVDSIALEVERIAEAQRFTAKLMSERLPNRLAERTPDRSIEQ
jgi:hypothetical protein